MKHTVLIQHNIAELISSNTHSLNQSIVGTLLSNMAYYGFCPSKSLLEDIQSCSEEEIKLFWSNLEPAISQIKAVDKNMNDHVVYKNFPNEVLSMSEGEYWLNQILMYVGLNDFSIKEEKKARSKSLEIKDLIVLSRSNEDTLKNIFEKNLYMTNSWTDNQLSQSISLLKLLNVKEINFSEISFKANAIKLASEAISHNEISVKIENATDVIRLAIFLSGHEDARLSSHIRFKKFKRSERRFFLELLENSKNLNEDMALNKKLWKGFLTGLHPSDYKFKKVIDAFDNLYNNKISSFQGKVDKILKEAFPEHYRKKKVSTNNTVTLLNSLSDSSIRDLNALKDNLTAKSSTLLPAYQNKKSNAFKRIMALFLTRPGEFVRQYHMLYNLFGDQVTIRLTSVLYKVNPVSLLKFKNYLKTVNDRKSFIYAPNGQWTKANFEQNNKKIISKESIALLSNEISAIISQHINEKFPEGISVDKRLMDVKLQTNSQELAPYGRGTSFPIAENIKFIRSGSYWQTGHDGNIWYDNGWNFFGEKWNPIGSCCWNEVNFKDGSSIFSGDPTTASTPDGKACQMIDLYIDKLLEAGVRYALWNILGYSGKTFSDAEDVIATLQLGENPSEDEIYEPSRATMVFPLKGDNLSKYISFIDLKERKIVYLDANLYGNVSSADYNLDLMSDRMPYMIEYLKSLPSIYDLLEDAKEGVTPFLFDDKTSPIDCEKAYVFNGVNPESKYQKISIETIL